MDDDGGNVDSIIVEGARVHNLKDVSVTVPKRQLVVFTGVSGSGKSSLVFDTLAAESQRQLNSTFSAFARNRLPQYGAPDVDLIDNLSTAIIVDQKRLGGGPRSTVGTVTEVNSSLRLLFSRVGTPPVHPATNLSFNEPGGMCERCDGIGTTRESDITKLLDTSLSFKDGAMLHPRMVETSWEWHYSAAFTVNNRRIFPLTKPLDEWEPELLDRFVHGDPSIGFEGYLPRLERFYLNRSPEEVSESYLRSYDRFVRVGTCTLCSGARLNRAALDCRINGLNIADYCELDVPTLRSTLRRLRSAEARALVASIEPRLERMERLGLGYLTMSRPTSTLSGGESQRIKMVRHLGASLVDLMYVFDEPTIGLHPHDVDTMVEIIRGLRDRGNSVLVVEHDRDVIQSADYIIDVGPGAGARGGTIVYAGVPEGLERAASSVTGAHLSVQPRLKTELREPGGALRISDVTANNLHGVTVEIPTGVLTAVTGVAGSGKSTLMRALGEQHDVTFVDQSAVSTSIRSCPATYTGAMDALRFAFAAENGAAAGLFSFNSTGACGECEGRGIIETDLAFLDPVVSTCPACGGARYNGEALSHTFDGLTIADALALTAGEAATRLESIPVVAARAQTLVDVGLDYLTLGQPLSTLSGGECQRIKLASELGYRGGTYVLDEPTTGLHMADVGRLLALLDRIVDGGNTVVVVEHNLDVIAAADHIVDMGPRGGHLGGEVVFTGTPAEAVRARRSLTGQHLKRAIG